MRFWATLRVLRDAFGGIIGGDTETGHFWGYGSSEHRLEEPAPWEYPLSGWRSAPYMVMPVQYWTPYTQNPRNAEFWVQEDTMAAGGQL